MIVKTVTFVAVMMINPVLAQAPDQAPADRAHFDHTPMFRSLDADNDDKLTRSEWLTASLPEGLLAIVDSNRDGSISLAEMNSVNSRKSVDANGDGQVTLDEFKAFKPPQPAAQ